MNWHSHFNKRCNKVRSYIRTIWRNKNKMDQRRENDIRERVGGKGGQQLSNRSTFLHPDLHKWQMTFWYFHKSYVAAVPPRPRALRAAALQGQRLEETQPCERVLKGRNPTMWARVKGKEPKLLIRGAGEFNLAKTPEQAAGAGVDTHTLSHKPPLVKPSHLWLIWSTIFCVRSHQSHAFDFYGLKLLNCFMGKFHFHFSRRLNIWEGGKLDSCLTGKKKALTCAGTFGYIASQHM